MNDAWELARLNYRQVREGKYEVAVLPLGATEPHNLHLPYATDTLEATIIGQFACRTATQRGARVILLPALPYGTQTNMRELPLAMNLYPSTLMAVVGDLVESVQHSGIRKMLLLNGHGGNDLKPVLRELAPRTSVHLFLCDWWRVIGDHYSEIFDCPEDHAGEMETSFALAYFPQWVARGDDGALQADAGKTRPSRFEAVQRGWVSITRPWHLLSASTGSGDPHAASAEKGQRLMAILEQRLADFLVELAAATIDDLFPFQAD